MGEGTGEGAGERWGEVGGSSAGQQDAADVARWLSISLVVFSNCSLILAAQQSLIMIMS